MAFVLSCFVLDETVTRRKSIGTPHSVYSLREYAKCIALESRVANQ